MRIFKDSEGREWQVAINVAAVKRVRELADVDLLQVLDGKLISQLADDPVLLVDVLYSLCKPQADQRGVTDEQFGAAMAGESIASATSALLEDLADFFHGHKGRVLRSAIARAGALTQQAADLAIRQIEAVRIEPASSPSVQYGSAPESSGATQESGPSAS